MFAGARWRARGSAEYSRVPKSTSVQPSRTDESTERLVSVPSTNAIRQRLRVASKGQAQMLPDAETRDSRRRRTGRIAAFGDFRGLTSDGIKATFQRIASQL